MLSLFIYTIADKHFGQVFSGENLKQPIFKTGSVCLGDFSAAGKKKDIWCEIVSHCWTCGDFVEFGEGPSWKTWKQNSGNWKLNEKLSMEWIHLNAVLLYI